MESTITQMANQIRQSRENEALKKILEENSKAEKALQTILEEFKEGFAEQLPLLDEVKIKYTAHYQDNRYPFKGSFILFQKEERSLKMDFNNQKSYRYGFNAYDSGTRDGGVYGDWEKEDFILFIYDNLLCN